jgi:signal transduction histidine kinase
VETTDRRRTEEALRQAQKMEAVGQLTGGIAHDFNNLLAGIMGSLELLQRRIATGRTDGVERYSAAAMTSAQRASALTQRLLAFARRQPLDPKLIDANRLVADMEDLLRRTLGPAPAGKRDPQPRHQCARRDAGRPGCRRAPDDRNRQYLSR